MTKKNHRERARKALKAHKGQADFFPPALPLGDHRPAFVWTGECTPDHPYEDHLGRRWFLCAPMSVHNIEVKWPPGEAFAGQTFPASPFPSHVSWRCAWISTLPAAS